MWECVAWNSQVTFSPHWSKRIKTRLPLFSGHSWKRDLSLKTIHPESAQFLDDRARHHSSRIWRWTDVRGKQPNNRWGPTFHSFSHVLGLYWAQECRPYGGWFIIANLLLWQLLWQLLYLPVLVVLGWPLSFWFWYLPLSTHSCQHYPTAVLLCRALHP